MDSVCMSDVFERIVERLMFPQNSDCDPHTHRATLNFVCVCVCPCFCFLFHALVH